MATLTNVSIYGINPTEQDRMIANSLLSIKDAQVYLIKSIDTQDEDAIIEANKIVSKLSKIEKKIKRLIQ